MELDKELDFLLTLHSPELAELAKALNEAQAMIDPPKKDKDNPFFRSKYADLASNVDATKAALKANGLSLTQQTTILPTHGFVLVSYLLHASGQWMRSIAPLRPVKNDPQGLGSVITYMRRYAWSAITGTAPEDDDGNAASDNNVSQPPAKVAKTAKPKQEIKPTQTERVQEWAKKILAVETKEGLDDVLADLREAYKLFTNEEKLAINNHVKARKEHLS